MTYSKDAFQRFPEIPLISVGGGEGSGKTSGIPLLKKKFAEIGVHALTVPEAATTLRVEMGVDIGRAFQPGNEALLEPYETRLFGLQMDFESVVTAFASDSEHRHVIVLIDRGLMDIYGFLAGRPDRDIGVDPIL